MKHLTTQEVQIDKLWNYDAEGTDCLYSIRSTNVGGMALGQIRVTNGTVADFQKSEEGIILLPFNTNEEANDFFTSIL